MDPGSLAHPRLLNLGGHAPPDTLASRHVPSEHPSALMTGDEAKKDLAPRLEDTATGIPDARPSNVRLKTGLFGAELRTFLGQTGTQAQIVTVVRARVDKMKKEAAGHPPK